MTRTRMNAKTIVAFQDGEHRILSNGCLVIEDDRIVFVGSDYTEPVEDTVELGNRLVTPGFINTHSHLTESPLDKSFLEDRGKRQFSMTGLAEMLPLRSAAIDDAGAQASLEFSMAELIRIGTTTAMEIGFHGEQTADAMEAAGLRGYVANGYKSGKWITHDGKRMSYAWDEAKGERDFAAARDFVGSLKGRAGGRISGFLSPMQVDTCTEALLRDTAAAAND
ncbi:MAG: amidohydrolase family protein, partial [Thermomicrobiales bacterium]